MTTITTVPVTCRALRPDGTPIAGGIIRFLLSQPDTENGVVVPREVGYTTDSSGMVAAQLWPNSKGGAGTTYQVLVNDPLGGITALGSCTVPNSPCNLWQIIDLGPPATVDAATLAKNAAQAAAADAETNAAAAHADRVQADADATATAADRVQTGLDRTATGADRVQTGLDRTQTGSDRTQTGADRVQTGLDRTATTASASAAAGSASAAAGSASSASSSASNTAALLASFRGVFLGAFASDSAAAAFASANSITLASGLMYENTTENKFRIYSGTAWGDYDATAAASQSAAALSAAAAAGSASTASAAAATATGVLADSGFIAVHSDLTNIDAVAGSISSVNTVAGDHAAITTVAGDHSSIVTVAGDHSAIVTVAGDHTAINTVAGDHASILTVAGDHTVINTVAGDHSAIAAIGADLTAINAVAADLTNINSASANATAAAASATAAAASAVTAAGYTVPSQTGNAGKMLMTSGTTVSWGGALFQSGNKVGVGTASPTQNLNVQDPALAEATSSGTVAIGMGDDTNKVKVIEWSKIAHNVASINFYAMYGGSVAALAMTLQASSAPSVLIPNYLGVGNVSPQYPVDITGNARITASLGIGATPSSIRALSLSTQLTGGTTQNGAYIGSFADSGATTSYSSVEIQPGLAAGSYTVATAAGINVNAPSIGSGAAITTWHGLFVASATAPTNARSYRSNQASGSNKYCLYMDGTAQNYLEGSLGVGTASPSAKLHVYQAGSGNTLPGNVQAIFEYGANGGIAISVPAGNAAGVYFPSGTNAYSSGLERNGTNLGFLNNGSERARIDSSGNLLVGKTSATSNAGDIQLSKGVAFPATQVPCSDANTLDDYEEGTWTPVIGGATSESGQTYSLQLGTYTKIGRMVHCQFRAIFTAKGTITGIVTLKGLPFSTPNANPYQAISGEVLFAALATSWSRIQVAPNLAAPTAVLYGVNAAGTSPFSAMAGSDISDVASFLGTFSFVTP